MPTIKWRDLKRMVEKDRWYLVSTKGSHRKYYHPMKSGMLVLSYHAEGRDVPVGTLKKILKDAGLQNE